MEVGARQKRLPKGLQSTTSKVAICRATSKDNNDESNLDHAGHRYKSSSFTRGGKDHEIVSAIREKLTVRKVDTPGLGSLVAPPLSITLRRASDASGSIFNRARERVDQLDSQHVQLLKMDANSLQFPDNSFDRVLAAYFISTVEDPVKAVLEMKRVCRRGGYLLFLNHFRYETPVVGQIEECLSPLFYRLGFRTDLSVHVLMEQTGLEIETLESIDSLGHWKAVRCVNPG